MITLAELIFAALMSLPPAAYPLGTEPESVVEREARYHLISRSIAWAAEDATCATTENPYCEPDWPGSTRELALLLVVQGWHESRFAWHVHAGRCRRWECDVWRHPTRGLMHRARSPWQLQASRLVPEWPRIAGADEPSTRLAARAAARVLAAARAYCGNGLLGAISGYATGGRTCSWSRTGQRLRTLRRISR